MAGKKRLWRDGLAPRQGGNEVAKHRIGFHRTVPEFVRYSERPNVHPTSAFHKCCEFGLIKAQTNTKFSRSSIVAMKKTLRLEPFDSIKRSHCKFSTLPFIRIGCVHHQQSASQYFSIDYITMFPAFPEFVLAVRSSAHRRTRPSCPDTTQS